MALTLLKKSKTYSVKEMIHRRLAGWERARDYKTLHASELMKDLEFCPREYALLHITNGKKKDQYVGTAQRMTFDHGKDMENRVRNDWLRDVAVGVWRCPYCGQGTSFGKVPKAMYCKCDTPTDEYRYEEMRFMSDTSGISGGVDLFVDVGDTKHRLVEIKSIDKDAFKELKAPLAEHKFRTNLYLRLVDEYINSTNPKVGHVTIKKPIDIPANTINVQRAHLLYVSKAYGVKDDTLAQAGIKDAPFSPIKEFIVERNDEDTQVSFNKAKALLTFRTTDEVPCGVCPNGLTKRAQKCSMVAACFSGKYPATITWIENGVPKHPGKKPIL